MIIKNCKICKKKISQGNKSGYCKSCAKKELYKNPKNNPNYKDGRSLEKHYCIDCPNEISYTNWLSGNKRCQTCANKNFSVKRKGKLNPNYIDGRSSKQHYCNCGKEIFWSTAINGNGNCQSCAKQGKGSPLYIDGRSSVKIFCKDCNKELSENAQWQGTERCKSCSRKGSLHVNWVEDRSLLEYPDTFNHELKDYIRQRDKYICQNCGETETEHLIALKRVLLIHHIDYNKQNCNESNLITLCFKCNIRANYNRDYWYAYYTYITENFKRIEKL